MKHTRILAMVLALLLAVSLAACGAKSEAGYDMAATAAGGEAASPELSQSGQSSQAAMPEGRKLIRTVTIDAQTRDMDALLTQVESRVAELGGYVEGRNVYNGTSESGETRNASMTVRIPADKLDQFVQHMDDNANIVTHRESTDDVTLNYVDTEGRVKALELQESRLLELMAQAEKLEDLLILEKELTSIRTELEQLKSRLRTMDSLVSYSTVYLSVTEVKKYTEPVKEEPPKTVWQRMGSGFMTTLKGVGNLLVNLAVLFVSALPVLLPLAAAAGVVLYFVRRKQRKEQAMREKWAAQKREEQKKTEEKTE